MSVKTISYLFGIVLSTSLLMILLRPQFETWHSAGPANPGHEQLNCNECHLPSNGNMRQQIQANLNYLLGTRQTAEDFVLSKINNKQCLACHQKKNDLHPSYRFLEPKYQKVRQLLHPEHCISCHQEHSGRRISHFKPSDCKHCHKNTKIEEDPISIPHDQLIAQKNWDSCLGCHDFHGNHDMKLETNVKQRIPESILQNYFNAGDSPYRGEIITTARETIYEN